MAPAPLSGDIFEPPTYSTESVVLAAGDSATIISHFPFPISHFPFPISHFAQSASTAAAVQIGTVEFTPPIYLSGAAGSNGSPTPPPVPTAGLTIAGPATIRAKARHISTVERSAFVTVSIVRANSSHSEKPSTAVVIPSDEGGDVEIIMESSTDMVTWTEALPGNYGTGTAKRFSDCRR